ncbi:caspase domain-containing protein [Mesorhizobium newzealandense]|uniref:Caspase domain-containing protein n=1 Tax=Mesorhizobium newzealandense TaxID=1300302 RepID=A0ABW4UG99_9HYPH
MTNARETRFAKRRAVVVGINDYQDGNNHLPSCINDVKAFEKILREDYAFEEIGRLVDSEATVAGVTAALQRLVADASPDDRLVFFFSGHGSTELRNGVAEQCMVLYDGYLFDDELSQMTQSLPPGIFTLVADCCLSGGLEKTLADAGVSGRWRRQSCARQSLHSCN